MPCITKDQLNLTYWQYNSMLQQGDHLQLYLQEDNRRTQFGYSTWYG